MSLTEKCLSQLFIYIDEIAPDSFLQAEQSQLSQLFHMREISVPSSSLRPFDGLAPACPSLSWSGNPRDGLSFQAVSYHCCADGKITLFDLLKMLL